MIFYPKSKKETRKIATDLAAKTKNGIVALEGELGAGKTVFAQAFIKALKVKARVKSPTFNIMKKYKIPGREQFIYHIDCYRLKDHREAMPLGIKDIFKENGAIILIEWPERISGILPKNIIRVHIDHINRNKRKIQISKPK